MIYRRDNLAGAERLELPTIGFGDRCSTNWNYAPASKLRQLYLATPQGKAQF